MARNTALLELGGIIGGYGDTMVLRDVSLQVPPSSVVAIIGPNGAGKTTCLRTAAGLLRPRHGQIHFDGRDVTRQDAAARAGQGMCLIPEGHGVFPSLTVRENIVLSTTRGREGEAVARAAEVFPVLGRRLESKAGTLSGGEQQMLALSRAYVRDVRLVMVDEASLGLAPVIVDAIFEFLGGLATQGTALLIVEQFVHRALQLAQYVYLMSRGSVAFHGTPAQLQESDVFVRYLGADDSVAHRLPPR
jgi:branched-chain amino acid transport system ATP-binding protein